MELPNFVTEAEYAAWDKKYPEIDIIEVESFLNPGDKLEVIVRRPDEIATLMSVGQMSNPKGNNIAAARLTLGKHCTLKLSPPLAKECEIDEYSHQHYIAIGEMIGRMYDITVATPKKKLKGISLTTTQEPTNSEK